MTELRYGQTPGGPVQWVSKSELGQLFLFHIVAATWTRGQSGHSKNGHRSMKSLTEAIVHASAAVEFSYI